MGANMTNTRRGRYLGVGIMLFCCFVVVFSTSTASAQAPLVTPTPTPNIVATRQAEFNAAQAQQQQADADILAAAERRRNADNQAAEAAQNLSDAKAKAAAQDGVAAGEAIGRAESDLEQMRESLDSIMEINAKSAATVKAQAAQKISDTLMIQDLQVRLQNSQNVVAAQSQTIADAQQAAPSPIVPLVVGALFMLAVVGIPVIIVLQRKPAPAPQYSADAVDSEIDTPSM